MREAVEGNGRRAVQTTEASTRIIRLPLPPFCAESDENRVRTGDRIAILFKDNKRVLGGLQGFDLERGVITILPDDSTTILSVGLSDFKAAHLLDPRKWQRATVPEGVDDSAVQHTEGSQDFEITLSDGDSLCSKTRGVRTDRNGFFLFPCQGSNIFFYSFIPHEAIKSHRIGPQIGSVLVGENLIDEEQLNSTLSVQRHAREQPLGEVLRTRAVVTTDELEGVLKRQKSLPNVRIGEVLIEDNMITEEQLQDALREQKKNRQRPLGEVLVEKGLVTQANIQQALGKKLGIPFVDLSRFEVDQDAVRLVPEHLVRKFGVMPLYKLQNRLIVAQENPLSWEPVEALAFTTKLQVEPVMASQAEIERMIDLVYSSERMDEFHLEDDELISEDEDTFEEQLDESAYSDNLVVKLVNRIIIDAYKKGASDVHIEPQGGAHKTKVRIRKDGVLQNVFEIPQRLRKALVSRIKIMADLDIAEKRRPQDSKVAFKKFSKLNLELRVATIPTAGGEEDVVMRLLSAGKPVALEALGLSERNFRDLHACIHKPYGLVLVCGPTGSGKTTSLHSALSALNKPERKIWTAEDPVEITQKGLRQVQVNPKGGVTFGSAMRSFLRADPDVIMVGEVRDEETASIAVEASLTGHLVLSTLHTNSAPESVTRLLDMGIRAALS